MGETEEGSEQHRFSFSGEDYLFDLRSMSISRPRAGPITSGSLVESAHIESCPPITVKGVEGVRYLSLHVAHSCPLACTYCYGNRGEYGARAARFMTLATAESAVDFLLANLGEHSVGHINFFGGEPLLCFDLVEHIVQYAKNRFKSAGRLIEFSLSTSGVVLSDAMVRLMGEEDFSVSLSIDGTREAHDRHRRYGDGTGSYDKALAGGQRLREAVSNVLITATLTRRTISLAANLRAIIDAGFTNVRFKIATGVQPEYQITASDFPVLFREYETAVEAFLNDLRHGRAYDFGDITKWVFRLERQRPVMQNCDAGSQFLNVDPDGTIFVCHRFVASGSGQVGTVHDAVGWDRSFIPNVFVDDTDCRRCWARYVCGGGCYYDGHIESGDVTCVAGSTKCALYRFQIELAIHVLATAREEGLLPSLMQLKVKKSSYETIV